MNVTRRVGVLLGFVLVAAACTASDSSAPATSTPAFSTPGISTPATTSPDGGTPSTSLPQVALDPVSHTVDRLQSVDEYEALAEQGIGEQSVLKFSITEFTTDPELVWLDPDFYTLHDEWYWFQLLNGTAVRGFDAEPVDGEKFDTVADVYDWAMERRAALPLDLRFTALDRLYSPSFYDLALDSSPDRRIGLGALIRTPDPETGDDRWVIELEFSDEVTVDQMETYFDVVGSAVPDDIATRLQWVPRSRAHEIVASEIETADGSSLDRIVRYAELTVPGETRVYASGIAAGRLLHIVEGGRWSLGDAGPDDIIAIDVAPDDLPPGNGLITGTPQTPLAHVNVLALNRGIPNAFLAGLADDPTLSQLGRVRAPVLVRATDDGELEIIPLTTAEYDGWRATRGRSRIAVDPVDRETLPLTRPISDIDTSISATVLGWLRPAIGGKAAGFVELATPGTVTMPPDAMVITVRSYLDHADGFTEQIDALLEHARGTSSVRSRFLLLEGRDDYDAAFTSPGDAVFADEFESDHPAGTVLGAILAADGFRRMFRDQPIDPANLSAITTAVAANFSDYAPTQGLRFRSSSTVEDIEGFNGAGLYDSNTGYLDPTVLDDPDDQDRTIERAILRTWSSYWSARAFEERVRENVDHASGSMAVLVHARFDDDLEVSNGVATITVRPEPDVAYEMDVNVQTGATSVTNAIGEDQIQPEIVRVTLADDAGEPVIDRIGASSIADGAVLDDAEIVALFAQIRPVADSWLARANDELPEAQRSSTLTLDYEFRQMGEGWPARLDGTVEPARMVVKQARTLDPGLRGVPAAVQALPIPRDVLAYASSIIEIDCTVGDGEPLVGVSVTTDPLARVDLGFADQPFFTWTEGVGDDIAGCEERPLLITPQRYLLDLLATR